MNLAEQNLPKIGIAGFGLIGGSLAKAYKSKGFKVAGFDINENVVKSALDSSAADECSTDTAVLSDADYIFIALYPEDTIRFVKNNYKNYKSGTVVIDCCGVKGYVCNELNFFAKDRDFIFIGGHPMSGKEYSGFESSDSNLFNNASFILTPEDGINVTIVENTKNIIKKAGFKNIVVTTPEHHDRMIAFTSQLPHVLACAYVKSPSCLQHSGFSAGSFNDVSRVAHINAPMWAQLFIDNKTEICKEIDVLIENINEIKNAVTDSDYEKLSGLLQQAGDIKDSVT